MCSGVELPTSVEQSIKNIIKMEEYLTYKIRRNRVITNGASYLGDLYEIDVEGKTKDGNKETNLFLKIINGSEKTKWISVFDIYRIELFTYKELFEIYAGMQEDANVPTQERFKMIKFYKDSTMETIILENIAKKGFKLYDRFDVITLEFAELSITQLAKLHALSFVLQEKRPDYFNKNIKKMQWPVNFKYFHGMTRNLINLTMDYIDDDVKSRVENAYYKLADKHSQFFENEATRRCICHGDYRLTNMMIKTHEGKILDFIIVDYQTLHYGCPAMDILYFIFLNTDRQFRKAHLSHLKDLYHETLTNFLGYFNIDVDLVYSRETFEQDFKEKLDYGLLVGIALLPLNLACEDDFPDLTGDVSGLSFRLNEKYRDRQREMIEEFIEWGYL